MTHSFNSDQRYIRLDFAVAGPFSLSVTAPPNGRIAPPGSYLLFLLNTQGIPSSGKFMRFGMHQQHVFYRNSANRIEHIFWDEPTGQLYRDNWTDRAGELEAAGEPCTMLTPFQQHIFYRAKDSSICHIFWDARPNKLFHDNWTDRANAAHADDQQSVVPNAAGDPSAMTTEHQQHIFYRTPTGAIHHILWDDRTAPGFFDDDWTTWRAPAAVGNPATLVTPHQQHIFYRSADGHIQHILWDDRTAQGFFADDWTAAGHALAAVGNPATLVTPHQQHIFYRSADGHIQHILWDDRTAQGFFADDWTAAGRAPAAVGDPATLVTPHQQHVFYRDANGNIQHILWDEWPQDFYQDTWTAQIAPPHRAASSPVTTMTRA